MIVPIVDEETELDIKLVSLWQEEDNVLVEDRKVDSLPSFIGRKADDRTFEENMMFYDAKTYLTDDILVKVDRASMSNSLEIRSPLLDRRVVDYSLKNCRSFHKIKNKQGKHILRKILKEYLPEKLFNRPKMGFGVPIDTLLNQQLNKKLKYFSSSEFI